MKTIQPISIWRPGGHKEAVILNSFVIGDNIKDSAQFYFQLLSEDKQNIAEGNLTMTGETYQAWTQNEQAWDFVANSLGVVITGDVVEPTQTIPVQSAE